MLTLGRAFSVINREKWLVAIVVLGLIVRVSLAPFSGQPFDVSTWYQISIEILSGQNVVSADMAVQPAFYYTLFLVAHFYIYLVPDPRPEPLASFPNLVSSAANWIVPPGAVVVVPDRFFLTLVKLPMILADLATGLLLYKIALPRYGEKLAFVAFVFWFLNPITIWVSSVWGMFDSLPTFFTLLSTYFLIQRRYAPSSLALAIAIAFKVYPILLLFPMMVYAYRQGSISLKKSVCLALSCIGTASIFFVPFLLSLIAQLNRYLIQPIGLPSSGIGTFGLTYWSIGLVSTVSGEMTRLISILLMLILIIGVYVMVLRFLKENSAHRLYFWQLASIAVIFFSYPQVNEQWFVWLLPFLILLSIGRGTLSKRLVLVLSVTALVYSWINSLFAAFFVPIANYSLRLFDEIYQVTSLLAPARLESMAITGAIFSILLLVALVFFHEESMTSQRKAQQLVT